MCLLVVLSRLVPGAPLVLGGNRDERLERPAEPMAVLRDEFPRTLGGRDLKAGGTWLAVNEAGVVAGLTNRPSLSGPDATKRSRGELPLALTAAKSAAAAVDAFAAAYRTEDYNQAFLLVGDRESLFAVELAGAGDVVVTELPPGVHILENRAMTADSGKVDRVHTLLGGLEPVDVHAAVAAMTTLLADHEIPVEAVPFPLLEERARVEAEAAAAALMAVNAVDEEVAPIEAGPDDPARGEEAEVKPPAPEVRAICVHTPEFGTRWSGIVTVPDDPSERPGFRYSDGPPCTNEYRDATALWD